MNEIKIKRFDTKTAGAAGFDLYSRQDLVVEPGTWGVVHLNVAIHAPDDYWVLLAARSSLYKKGLQMVNGVGIGDADFRGDNDEYRAVLFNFTKEPVSVERGERLVQAVLIPLVQFPIIRVTQLDNPDRGGFGSTGTH